jgi:hypothetical protein
MSSPRVYARGFALVAIVGATVAAAPQSIYVEGGGSAAAFEVAVELNGPLLERISAAANVSIGGRFDIGLGVEVVSGIPAGVAEVDTTGQVLIGGTIIKQGTRIPVGLYVGGSYGLAEVRGDALTLNREIKRGTGYSLGVMLYRLFDIGAVRLLVGAAADYAVANRSTSSELPQDPALTPNYPILERTTLLTLGLRTNIDVALPDGQSIGLSLSTNVDVDGVFRFGSGLTFVSR